MIVIEQYGKPVSEDHMASLDLQIIVSMNKATFFKDATRPPAFSDFTVLPSLGVGATRIPASDFTSQP